MFKRLADDGAAVALTIDGKPVRARSVDTVAAALLAAGIDRCRTTPVTGAPRLPYCLMGVCFDCLVTIDDQPNQRACLIPAEPDLTITSQLLAAKNQKMPEPESASTTCAVPSGGVPGVGLVRHSAPMRNRLCRQSVVAVLARFILQCNSRSELRLAVLRW